MRVSVLHCGEVCYMTPPRRARTSCVARESASEPSRSLSRQGCDLREEPTRLRRRNPLPSFRRACVCLSPEPQYRGRVGGETYICLPPKMRRCCAGGMPSFSSTRSLMRWILSVGSMSNSISTARQQRPTSAPQHAPLTASRKRLDFDQHRVQSVVVARQRYANPPPAVSCGEVITAALSCIAWLARLFSAESQTSPLAAVAEPQHGSRTVSSVATKE